MQLWTIQTLDAWEAFQRAGTLATDCAYAEPSCREAYAWMIGQMTRRIGPRPPSNITPLWAWYQYDGVRRRRPDLRSSAHLPRGVRGVRLELDLPAAAVLLSDFELWHYVLNGWYLPASEADGHAFEHEALRAGVRFAREHARQSWNRIFDLDWYAPDIAVPRDKKSIQAVFWSAPLDAVRAVTPFTAR